MTGIDPYIGAGYALELLTRSDYHRQMPVGDLIRSAIVPPLWYGQCRFYLSEDGRPTGMITWAWLSEEVERDVHATGRALTDEEWMSGDRLFFNDWITPSAADMRFIIQDIGHNVFPDGVATSLRRNPDGSVRRINRWTGARRRQAAREAAA